MMRDTRAESVALPARRGKTGMMQKSHSPAACHLLGTLIFAQLSVNEAAE
jgi:hypothetical protein